MKVFATSHIHYEIPELGIVGRDFPVISITGTWCELKCKHCYGKLLERMISATTPEKLMKLGERLRREGVSGVLISGGCDSHGKVPFEKFVDAIKYLKSLGLKIFMHSGLVDEQRAQLIREAGVDVVLLDLIVDDEVIRSVLNLNVPSDLFVESVKNLLKFDVRVAPHIVVGINGGMPSSEFRSIDVLSRLNPHAAVIVVFTPYPGTPFENREPPDPTYVVKVIEYARRELRDIPLSLGCMRPRSEEYQVVEIRAIDLGFDGIAFPSHKALNYMLELGIEFRVVHACCASLALE